MNIMVASLVLSIFMGSVGEAVVAFSQPSERESIQTLLLGRECITFGQPTGLTIITFPPDDDVIEAMAQVTRVAGVHRNGVILRQAIIPDAAAITCGEHRYILYDRTFFNSLEQSADSFWAIRSILAHELGHHLNGHTLSEDPNRINRELEADFYSGFLMQKMGADSELSLTTMSSLGDEAGSEVHPPLSARLEAIYAGWQRACDADPTCEDITPTRVAEGSPP